MKTSQILIVIASMLAITGTQAQTTSSPSAATEPPSAFEDFVKQSKNPASWLTWGADLRLRNEYFNNAITLDEGVALHEQDYFRFRGRGWASITPIENLSLNSRVSGEPRDWMNPTFGKQRGVGRTGWEWRYGIVDNLNVKWSAIMDQPLTLTVGRQDVQFGEPLNWWLVADGTPGDGSWTFFLDSIRLGYEAKDINTKFDLVYVRQTVYPDEWMPTMGDSSRNRVGGAQVPYTLTEQNEQGAILYVSNKSIENAQIDGYFIYKNDDRAHTKIVKNGDNADIYTIGAKVSGTPAEHWQYSLEGAYQCGNKEDKVSGVFKKRDISAYGANGKLTYLFKDKLNNQLSLIGEFLSGDDKHSKGTDEMFDLLWGRWPRFSELYIYSYIQETSGKIAQVNNIERIGLGWSMNPMKNMTVSAIYNAWFAPEETPTRAINAGAFSGKGNFRGHYIQALMKYKFNDHLAGHLWSEFVWQGDYYARRDMLSFLRAEINLTW